MTYTEKQKSALKELNADDMYYLLVGGSRSGKTWLNCKYIVTRALKYPKTRHLICRQSKASCVNTVWKQTLLPLLAEYPADVWYEDKTNRVINFINGASIWAGGFENKLHEDAVLGSEYATIFVNEAIDSGYQNFSKLRTRLNWKGIKLKLIADCNPKAPSHWVNQFFNKKIDPEERTALPASIANNIRIIHFHPNDNRENLSAAYLEQLESLKGLAKKRFWDGVWAEDMEGLVFYNFERKKNIVERPITFDANAETFTAWDFGTADPTFIIVGQIVLDPTIPEGHYINIIDEYRNTNKDVAHYAAWCKSRPWFNSNRRDYGDPAGKNRDAQLKSWISLLMDEGINITYTKRYTIDEYVDAGNDCVSQVRICESQCPMTVEMFENWKYPLDGNGKKVIGTKPEHDIYSHPGTAFYYFAANRFGTKKARMIV